MFKGVVKWLLPGQEMDKKISKESLAALESIDCTVSYIVSYTIYERVNIRVRVGKDFITALKMEFGGV